MAPTFRFAPAPTNRSITMRTTTLALLLTLTALPAIAQTTHVVTVENVSFSPADLAIDAGDTVEWQNMQGVHNVDGTLTENPSNPEGFTSGAPAGAPWTFSFTFKTPGSYSYHCDVHGSPNSGMRGTVTVGQTSSVEEEEEIGFELSAPYPNPFSLESAFTLTLARAEHIRIAVYDAHGRRVSVLRDGQVAAATSTKVAWTPSEVAAGAYVISIEGESFQAARKVIHVP